MKVQNSGRITPKRIGEQARGTLAIFDAPGVPFAIKRIYTIQDVSNPVVVRGGHAHKKNDQALFVLQGALTLHLDDGRTKEDVRVSADGDGVRLGPMLWHSMSAFTPDAIALVLASEPYDESDYIRDYDEFKKHVADSV